MEKYLRIFIEFKKTVSVNQGRSLAISYWRPLLGTPVSELRVILSVAPVVFFFLELLLVTYWYLG